MDTVRLTSWIQIWNNFHSIRGNKITGAQSIIHHYVVFVNVIRTGSVVAEVGPGDMLAVPPFWYHHVETLSESVSVNVWSDAPEYYIINKV